MRKVFNECVDCDLPCIGNQCPNRNVVRHFCDQCGEETDLYYYEGEELCIDCIASKLEKVED